MEFQFDLFPIFLKYMHRYICYCLKELRLQFFQSFMCFLKTFVRPIRQLLLYKFYLVYSHLDKRFLPLSKAKIDFHLLKEGKVLKELNKSKIYILQLPKLRKICRWKHFLDNAKKRLFFLLDHCFYTCQRDLALS